MVSRQFIIPNHILSLKFKSIIQAAQWRGARVDDWGGLENRCGFRVTVGSNPTLSAKPPNLLSAVIFLVRLGEINKLAENQTNDNIETCPRTN